MDLRELIAAKSTDRTAESCLTWEIAIFAECASQDSSFIEVVLGDRGIPSMIPVLQGILSQGIISTMAWDHVCCVVSVLNKLSRHAWIAQTVEPGLIGLLLNVFR